MVSVYSVDLLPPPPPPTSSAAPVPAGTSYIAPRPQTQPQPQSQPKPPPAFETTRLQLAAAVRHTVVPPYAVSENVTPAAAVNSATPVTPPNATSTPTPNVLPAAVEVLLNRQEPVTKPKAQTAAVSVKPPTAGAGARRPSTSNTIPTTAATASAAAVPLPVAADKVLPGAVKAAGNNRGPNPVRVPTAGSARPETSAGKVGRAGVGSSSGDGDRVSRPPSSGSAKLPPRVIDNVDLNAFLPPPSTAAAAVLTATDEEILGSIHTRLRFFTLVLFFSFFLQCTNAVLFLITENEPMLTVLTTRLRNVKFVRSLWTAGKTREAMEELASLQDQAVLVDVLVWPTF
jgi:hypothetical protein